MMKGWKYLSMLFILCFFGIPFFSDAKTYVYNGQTYDDHTVADLITVITTTNPIPSIPSTRIIYDSQKSLFRIPAFALCKKIIVFDGIQPGFESRADDYEKYKQNLVGLTHTDPYFTNTEFVFCKEWGHISGAVREAIQYVTTPFLFIHQHDFNLIKDFDLNGLIVTMIANPEIKHVRMNQNPSVDSYLCYDIAVEPVYMEPNVVPLWKNYGWSDNDHITTLQYYQDFVLPRSWNQPLEWAMDPFLKATLSEYGEDFTSKLFGTYIYGRMNEGPYIFHTDGRNSY